MNNETTKEEFEEIKEEALYELDGYQIHIQDMVNNLERILTNLSIAERDMDDAKTGRELRRAIRLAGDMIKECNEEYGTDL